MVMCENYKFEALDENYRVTTYNTMHICSNTLILTRTPYADIYWLYCCLPDTGFVWVTHYRIFTPKEFAKCMAEYREKYGRYPEMVWGHKIREGK